MGKSRSRREESFQVFTVASLSPVGRRGGQGDRSSSADTPRFYPEVCWEPLISSPGPTQNSPSLFRATNHLGVGPVSPLRRQTDSKGLASALLLIHSSLRLHGNPAGGGAGTGPFQRSARGRTRAFCSLVPLRCRCFTSGSSSVEDVVFCAESEGLVVSLFLSLL